MSLLSLPAHPASSPALAPALPFIALCGEDRDSVHRASLTGASPRLSHERHRHYYRTHQPTTVPASVVPGGSSLAACPGRSVHPLHACECTQTAQHSTIPGTAWERGVRNTDLRAGRSTSSWDGPAPAGIDAVVIIGKSDGAWVAARATSPASRANLRQNWLIRQSCETRFTQHEEWPALPC